jgi:hypothetical protein
MKRHRTAMVFGLGLSLAVTQAAAAQTAPDPARSQQFPSSGTADPIANEGMIEDGAIDALKEMSNYLMTAKTLGIVSHASRDVVTNDGQRIQLEGTATYKVRRPGFVIDYVSDIKSRRFIYDEAGFLRECSRTGHEQGSPRHDLQQVRHCPAARRPIPLGQRRGERCANPGPEVRL